MIGQIQGIRSTKNVNPAKTASTDKTDNQHEKSHDILIKSYKMKNTMYTDQTEQLPHSSSQGKRYHMIIHDIDNNSTWAETIKYRK